MAGDEIIALTTPGGKRFLDFNSQLMCVNTATAIRARMPRYPVRTAVSDVPLPSTPLITVITPAFNAERFIAEAIESVLSQTLEDFEYLIVDDGSADRTATIAEEYAARHPRVSVLSRQVNAGSYQARNEGLERARGRYVAFLDADDTWEPSFLSTTFQEMTKSSDVGAVFSWSVNVGEDAGGRVWAPRGGNYDFYALFRGICPPGNGSCLLIDARCFSEVGRFLTTLRVGADSEMWLRISSKCSPPLRRFRCLPHVLVNRRITSTSLSADFFTESRLAAWTYRLDTYLGYLSREQQFDVWYAHFLEVGLSGNGECSDWLDHWKRKARDAYPDQFLRRRWKWFLLSLVPAGLLVPMVRRFRR